MIIHNQREFHTADEIAEAHALALGMHELYDVAARLDAAKAAVKAADAAKREAAADVAALRATRTGLIASLGADLRVHELVAITRMAQSEVSRTLKEAPTPPRRRGGPLLRPR